MLAAALNTSAESRRADIGDIAGSSAKPRFKMPRAGPQESPGAAFACSWAKGARTASVALRIRNGDTDPRYAGRECPHQCPPQAF